DRAIRRHADAGRAGRTPVGRPRSAPSARVDEGPRTGRALRAVESMARLCRHAPLECGSRRSLKFPYGAKYPEMSRINCVVPPPAKASVEPFTLGTMARFEVTKPSFAFNVDTIGWVWPSAHNVRYPNVGLGITVALKTYA